MNIKVTSSYYGSENITENVFYLAMDTTVKEAQKRFLTFFNNDWITAKDYRFKFFFDKTTERIYLIDGRTAPFIKYYVDKNEENVSIIQDFDLLSDNIIQFYII